jgi:hypothetical protein
LERTVFEALPLCLASVPEPYIAADGNRRQSLGCATNSSLAEISEIYFVEFLFRLERRLKGEV